MKTGRLQKNDKGYNYFMRNTIMGLFIAFLLSSCDIWGVPPQPIPIQSPIPSNTPVIVTPTPNILPPPTTISGDSTLQPTLPTTETPPPSPTFTLGLPSPTNTQPITQAVEVEILGCDTGFDIQNGMFEVTNAYVTIKNTGTVDLPETCALLRAIDEGRPHPDKTVCTGNLPTRNQVTLKLTVDSTYKEDTIIQVDVTTNNAILLRVDKQSCRDIKIFGGVPTNIGIIQPMP
jgi:hypothetical protein